MSSTGARMIGKYTIVKTLGRGTFAKVKQAENEETKEMVAIKVLEKSVVQKEQMGNQVRREISIMKKINHENVVKLYEVLASKTKIYIVLELVIGGELFKEIVREKRLDEETSRFYFQQLCVATHYCHTQGICHRDLKPENLLLDSNRNLKISDFGLSSMFEVDGGSNLCHTMCGTPNYVAPEVVSDKKRGYDGTLSDTWSTGVVLYVFLAGVLPFDEQSLANLFQKIERAEYKPIVNISPEARDLVAKILVPDVRKRYTIPDIALHPWWTQGGPNQFAGKTMQRSKKPVVQESEEDEAIQEMQDVEVENLATSLQQNQVHNNANHQQQQQQHQNMAMIQTFQVFETMSCSKTDEDDFKMMFTRMNAQSFFPLVLTTLQNVPGLMSSVYPSANELALVFDQGRGRCVVRIASFVAGNSLYMVKMNRAGGDYTTFAAVVNGLMPLAEFLSKTF